jgi:hypothetical protein
VEPAHRAADGGIGRLTAPLQYRERAPHPGLVDDIACTWSGAARPGLRILPDGCIDIVWIGDEALTVAGPDTAANLAGLPDGTLTVGARFRASRAPGYLGVAAHELTDRSISLEDLWGVEARRLAERLASAVTDKDATRTEPWGQTVARLLSPKGLVVGVSYAPSMR